MSLEHPESCFLTKFERFILDDILLFDIFTPLRKFVFQCIEKERP